MDNEFVVVFCTVPDLETARTLAREVVERRLAACVNIVPGLVSIYRWDGAVHEDAECLLVAKTRASGFDALAAAVAGAHPYQVPEIVGVPLVQGHAPYLDWLRSAT